MTALRQLRASAVDIAAELPVSDRDAFYALITGSRAAKSNQGYAQVYQRYLRFCDSRKLQPVPAAPATVVSYLLHLQRENRVHGGGVRQHMAAIKAAHELAGFVPPQDASPLVKQSARGFSKATERNTKRLRRAPLTTDAALLITRYGLRALEQQRYNEAFAAAALVFGFCFFARASTVCQQQLCHVSVSEGSAGMRVRLSSEKGKQGPERDQPFMRVQLSAPWPHPYDLLAATYSVAAARNDLYWFGGKAPLAYDTLREWWRSVPAAAGCSPPAGYQWLPHSARSGGASAAIQAGVPDIAVQARGGWLSSRAMQGYIFSVVRHPADYLFFGFLSPLVRPYE